MALLGSTVDPRLFVQDYSGFTRAADIQGQSMANLGGQIAGGIERYGEQKQERKKLDAGIKATVTGIESAIKMGKSLGIDVESSLTPYLEKINDPNVSPIEAAAYAQQASNSISNVLNFGMKANEMGIEKERYRQATAARIAELQSSKWQPYDKEIAIDGQKVKVTGSLDQFGQFKDINNNVYSSVADAFAPVGQAETPLADGAYPDGVPTDGTPMDGPGVLPLDKQDKVPEPPINFDFNQSPSVPGDTKVAPEVVANIEAAGGVPVAKPPALNLPPGASIVEEKPKEVRIITGPEAKAKGLDPAGTYEQTYENGKLVGIQTITPPPTISQIAQVEKSKADIKASEAEVQKAQRSKDIAIKTMSDYVDEEGKPTERLDKAVGYGEEAATYAAEYVPILGTQSGETRSDQQRLNRLVETDILEAASLLKPVSNTDLLMLIKNRPTITQPTEVWTKYFSDIKQILSNPENYISSDGGTEKSKVNQATEDAEFLGGF